MVLDQEASSSSDQQGPERQLGHDPWDSIGTAIPILTPTMSTLSLNTESSMMSLTPDSSPLKDGSVASYLSQLRTNTDLNELSIGESRPSFVLIQNKTTDSMLTKE